MLTVIALGGCRADGVGSGAPAALRVIAGANQQTTVGQAVATPPEFRVVDPAGDPVSGVQVSFSIIAGGGSLIGDSAVTDAQGRATVGAWIMGTVPGTNSMQATVVASQLAASVSAVAQAGGAASVRASGTAALTGLINQPVTPAPAVVVLDRYGNPVAGVVVTFSITQGGGSLSGANATTDASGTARVGSWTLGPASGVNLLVAQLSSGTSFVFSATALAGAPTITATSPTSQSGYLAFPVTAIPRVLATDASGDPLAGVRVIFTVSGTGATVSGDTAFTDADGVAAPADWRLGTGTSSTLTATVGLGAPPVEFTATGVPANFLIDMRFLTPMTPDVRDAFVAAARRWMQIITAHLDPVPVDLPAGACAAMQPAIDETVGDLVIFAQVSPIDGVGNILGSASPCTTRSGSQLPVVGSMQFDSADLQALISTGQLTAVITHEMAHVLGFGTLWSNLGLTQGLGGPDPLFIGPIALGLWPSFEPQLDYPGQPIPLENLGGAGTRDAHWRESVFHAELMTGYIEAPGVPMPLSKLTIATMADMGYQVDYSQADPFAGNLLAASSVTAPPTLLDERITGPTWRISPSGQTQRIP